MIKRDELKDPESCLNRAQMNEYMFVLLGRDEAAPATIRAWVRERVRLGKNEWTDPQISEALVCAERMEAGKPYHAPQLVEIDLTIRYSMHVIPLPGETQEEAVVARRRHVWDSVRSFYAYMEAMNRTRTPDQLIVVLVEARDDAGESFVPPPEH